MDQTWTKGRIRPRSSQLGVLATYRLWTCDILNPDGRYAMLRHTDS
jgi:hypothetical protein